MLSKCPLNTDRFGALITSLRKLVPGTDHPLGEEVSPTEEPALAQLWIIPTCPVTGFQGEELNISRSVSPPEEGVESSFHIKLPNLFLATPKHKAIVQVEQIQRSEWNMVHWKISNMFLASYLVKSRGSSVFWFFFNPRSPCVQCKSGSADARKLPSVIQPLDTFSRLKHQGPRRASWAEVSQFTEIYCILCYASRD